MAKEKHELAVTFCATKVHAPLAEVPLPGVSYINTEISHAIVAGRKCIRPIEMYRMKNGARTKNFLAISINLCRNKSSLILLEIAKIQQP